MNLILFEPSEVGDSGRVHATGVRARHLLNVLKVPSGHQVRVGIIDGPMGVGTVAAISADSVALDCVFDASAPERRRRTSKSSSVNGTRRPRSDKTVPGA